MATSSDSRKKWTEVGRSTSTPASEKERKSVVVDDFYIVVGFEVNNPNAFVNDALDLAIDTGHAFFYVVVNGLVEKVFSFGPSGAGKVGWFNQGNIGEPNLANTGAVLKDGFRNSRPGTPDYAISELITAFKVPVDYPTGLNVLTKTEEMRQRIINGKQRYTIYMNDTCAETTRDVLSSAGVETPSGSGIVRHSGVGIATGTVIDTRFGSYRLGFTAVNPYMWEKNFASAGKYPTAKRVLRSNNPADLVGSADPIF